MGIRRIAGLVFVVLLAAVVVWAVRSPVPPGRLPRPAPSRKFSLEPVFVLIEEESVDGKPELVSFLEERTKEYLRLFGHPAVDDPDDSEYQIHGRLVLEAMEPVMVESVVVEHKYQVTSFLEIRRNYEVLDRFEYNAPIGRFDPQDALETAKRTAAGKLLSQVFESKQFGNKAVLEILRDIVNPPEDAGTFNEAIEKLASIGLPAVPHLIVAFADNRRVGMKGSYPGLTPENRKDLKLYHVADKVLERIFGLASRLEIDSPRTFVRRVDLGWRKEWRKHCGAYRR